MVKLPKYSDPTPDRRAKAPYNFVPLMPFVAKIDPLRLPDQDQYHLKRYTGRLSCTLETSSPLYVRAALSESQYGAANDASRPWREQVRNDPSFYYTDAAKDPLDRRPVIPGSSIRGMLRAMVEIASYSKMDAVSDRQLVYRAVGDTTSHGEAYRDRLMRLDGEDYEDGKRCLRYTPLMRAGYMRRNDMTGSWQIVPAREVNGTTFARISNRLIPTTLREWQGARARNANEIWVKVGPYDYQRVKGGFIRTRYARVLQANSATAPGFEKACLARSGWMPNKLSEVVIFPHDERADPIDVEDALIEQYREQLATILTHQATRGGQRQSLLGGNGVLEEDHPVFYLVEGGRLVFFGHCMMFRLPYQNSLRAFVPEELRRETDTDLAEAIFGYSKGQHARPGEDWSKVPDKVRAYAGRVFVSDATALGKPRELWLRSERPIVPRILGTPKPTTFQHYLVQPTPNSIPAGRTRDGREKTRLSLYDFAAKPTDETVIRGHKLYWHKGNVGVAEIEEPAGVLKSLGDFDTQHTQIHPVKAGVRFKFEIAFENLSQLELGLLLWVLNVAADERYRLSLGMGKPLGMGAVRIETDLLLSNRERRYTSLFGSDGSWELGEQAISAADRQKYVDDFEARILDRVRGKEEATRLADLHRVRSLLALLSWPGPDREETRYLEIERDDPRAKRGKVNEYRDRPVLPDPLLVAGKPARPPDASTKPAASKPASQPEPDVGANYLRGTVKNFGLGSARSFGFITIDDPSLRSQYGVDIFVHRSNLAGGLATLEPQQAVVFQVVKGKKGWEARDVKLAQAVVG